MTTSLTRRLSLRAHAKVNLCLSVHYPPVNGYHELESVFQTIDLSDELDFTTCEDDDIGDRACTALGTPVVLNCGGVDIPVADNLIFRAVDGIERACGMPIAFKGQRLVVDVDKHIPAGGGLGGGSSDAAAALRAYATFHSLNPLGESFLEVARSLGADVAFFLYGGAALMSGRGDRLERCLPNLSCPLVLMGDATGNDTGAVYRAFDAAPQPEPDARALADAMESSSADVVSIAQRCDNNLERSACTVDSALAKRLGRARSSEHAMRVVVSGSGSTSFAICEDEGQARSFAEEISPFCAWTRVVHAVDGQ